jgi:octaprenyl-diphosphate synthase
VTTPTKSRRRERSGAPDLSLAEALELVEVRLAELLGSRERLLTDISTYLVGSGGKRVRPAVTVLVYRACGGRERADIIDVATALELIHSATLLHDDIIDNSETRRGKDSAFRKYGLASTLVTGDFIFSRAFQLCGRFEEQVISWAAEACISLTEGEVMQARFRHNPAVTLDDYLEIISRKTASIFRQGARTAAYLAHAPDAMVESMANCGFNVGMTFQIVDDLLDVAGQEAHLGKPVGIDLRDGNPSLPMVLALQRCPQLAHTFAKPDPDHQDLEVALRLIRDSGVLNEVRSLAAAYGTKARANLETLAPSMDRDQLLTFVEQLMDRAA